MQFNCIFEDQYTTILMNSEADYYWNKVYLKGDIKAFEWIYKNTFQSLCFYALQITGDKFLAEEVVQETLIKIWNTRDQIHITENIRPYLYKAIHNHAINKLIQQNTNKYSVNRTAGSEIWQIVNENYAHNAFLSEMLEAKDTEKIIDTTVKELPEQCRQVFCLSKYEEKTNDEIAAILNLSVNTVRTQLYRALEKIKEALEKKS